MNTPEHRNKHYYDVHHQQPAHAHTCTSKGGGISTRTMPAAARARVPAGGIISAMRLSPAPSPTQGVHGEASPAASPAAAECPIAPAAGRWRCLGLWTAAGVSLVLSGAGTCAQNRVKQHGDVALMRVVPYLSIYSTASAPGCPWLRPSQCVQLRSAADAVHGAGCWHCDS